MAYQRYNYNLNMKKTLILLVLVALACSLEGVEDLNDNNFAERVYS
jgi:hypothetical protein